MGGFGSGRWFFHERKDIVDSYLFIDINKLNRDGLLKPGMFYSFHWNNKQGKKLASIAIKVVLNHLEFTYRYSSKGTKPESVTYEVPVEWSPCNFGGERPWFICPGRGCWSRVARLYLIGKYFRCRHCSNLGYHTQRLDRFSRLLDKANSIRDRLGGKPGMLSSFPDKPKGMHWKTYYRMRREVMMTESNAMGAIRGKFGI